MNILNNIDNAFTEISYMKDTFQREFSQYASQIPEYDKLIQNMSTISSSVIGVFNSIMNSPNKFYKSLKLKIIF